MPKESAEPNAQESEQARDRRAAGWTACVCLTALTVLVGFPTFRPPGPDSWYPRCLFHAFTGAYCLTCGGTRALALLGRGHVLRALHMNAVVVLGAAALCYAGLSHAVYALGGPKPVLPRVTPKRLLILGLVLLAFWIARNIPTEPFRRLAPR